MEYTKISFTQSGILSNFIEVTFDI